MGDSLGDRMKGYEGVTRSSLIRRMPVIIRVDGKAFHTLTRGMDRPFDHRMVTCMQATAKELCEQIQGARVAYVQSDEISVLLVDYQALGTQAWLDGGLQKMCSISASIATMAFNREFGEFLGRRPSALFDSRVFNLPREEVVNYFVWRQLDATRNSIEATGQAHFSDKELHGVNCDQIQEKLFQAHGINWNDTPTHLKRGACVVREALMVDEATRHRWKVDRQIPVFTRDRGYVGQYLYPDEEPGQTSAERKRDDEPCSSANASS